MKIDPNDPRLTAYALGELNEHDRAEFRVLLNADPEARQEVERIQRAASALSKQLAAEPCPGLEPGQRLAVHEKLIPQETSTRGKFHWWIGLLAGAAALGLVAGVFWPQLHASHQRRGSMVLFTPASQPAPTVNGQSLSVNTTGEIRPPSATNNSLNVGGFGGAAGNALAMNGSLVTNWVGNYATGEAPEARRRAQIRRGPGWPDEHEVSAASSFTNGTLVTGSGHISQGANSNVGEIVVSAGDMDMVVGDNYAHNNTVSINNGGSSYTSGVLTNAGSVAVYARAEVNGGWATSSPHKGSGGADDITSWNTIGGIGGAVTKTGGGNVVLNDGHLALGNGQSAGSGALVVNGGTITMSGQPVAPTAGYTRMLGDFSGVSNGAVWISGGANNSVTVLGNTAWNLNGAPLTIGSNGAYTYYVIQPRRVVPTEPSISPGTESYAPIEENPFHAVTKEPLSTFGLDVNTASYANLRRFLTQGQLPPRDAVRIEEMLNYFPYDYPAPPNNDPFALYVEMGECPWNSAHQLALIGLKAKEIKPRQQPALNLVFLLDISGSMADENKLPLIKQALHLLVNQLGARDRVSIVVYANNSKVLLHSTHGDDHETILAAIDQLYADGGTNGGEGIQSAYREARANFIEGGINRVILCTDGDFNVGITDPNELGRMIENLANTGVFLNVFGFGMGNVKDSTMEKLAKTGRGQYAYIDDLEEARKNLVDQGRSTFVTVAKDSKIQIEFNPAHVAAYRLIGYEDRVMPAQAFNNDHVTAGAGSVGAAHTVTALYEIIPAGEGNPAGVDPLKYQAQPHHELQPRVNQAFADEWMTIKLRYKEPDGESSKLLTAAIKDSHLRWRTASDDFRFAAAVADFGMVLRDSPQKGDASLNLAIDLANDARRHDPDGYRAEFIELVKRAQALGQR